jgi:hypothetical protein
VAQLKRETISERAKMTELIEGYNDTLELTKFATRRVQPLHRQLQNLYRKNMGF